MIKGLSIIFPQNPINGIVGMAGLVEPAQADFRHRCSTPRIELETKSFYGFILILQQMNSRCWIQIPSADGAAASSEWNSTFIAFVEIGRVFLMCFYVFSLCQVFGLTHITQMGVERFDTVVFQRHRLLTSELHAVILSFSSCSFST